MFQQHNSTRLGEITSILSDERIMPFNKNDQKGINFVPTMQQFAAVKICFYFLWLPEISFDEIK